MSDWDKWYIYEDKYIFFAVTEYPGVRDSFIENELKRCGAEVCIAGKGAELVVVRPKNARQDECVKEVLNMADFWYFEMLGTPRSLYLMSPRGFTKAEVHFK
jgi:hypothetical protein